MAVRAAVMAGQVVVAAALAVGAAVMAGQVVVALAVGAAVMAGQVVVAAVALAVRAAASPAPEVGPGRSMSGRRCGRCAAGQTSASGS